MQESIFDSGFIAPSETVGTLGAAKALCKKVTSPSRFGTRLNSFLTLIHQKKEFLLGWCTANVEVHSEGNEAIVR
jgi:hypothetical protein